MKITPRQLNMTAEQTIDIYRELESEIFNIIANRLKNKGADSLLDWQMQKMSELHLVNNEILQLLSDYSGIASDEIRRVIIEAGHKCIDDVDSYMPKKLPKPHSNSIDIMMEGYVQQTFREINNYVNQTLISSNYRNTIMLKYQDTMNKIAAKYMSGMYTLDEAIYKTVVDWSKEGIRSTFIDKGGHTWSMERYVDMVMRTTLQRTYNEVRSSRMAEYDVHTVLVSSHSKARPACAYCQGTVVDLRPPGRNTSGYRSVYEFGYGEPAGHRGINCTHMHFPFIPGVSENNQPQYDPEEAIENAGIEQGRQRISREIRQIKKELIVAKELDKDKVPEINNKLRAKQAKMREYVQKYNLKRDYQLEKVYTPRELLIKEQKYKEFDKNNGRLKDKLKVEKLISDNEINASEFKRLKRKFDNSFMKGVVTREGTIYNKSNSFYHIVAGHHKDMFSDKGIERIIDALENPGEIYVTKDKRGKEATTYVEAAGGGR